MSEYIGKRRVMMRSSDRKGKRMHGKAIGEWNQRQGRKRWMKKQRRNKGNLLSQWRKRERKRKQDMQMKFRLSMPVHELEKKNIVLAQGQKMLKMGFNHAIIFVTQAPSQKVSKQE